MKWLAYSLAISLVASGTLVASSSGSPPAPGAQESSQTGSEPQTDEEDFIPSEKVPADSAISFPVDI